MGHPLPWEQRRAERYARYFHRQRQRRRLAERQEWAAYQEARDEEEAQALVDQAVRGELGGRSLTTTPTTDPLDEAYARFEIALEKAKAKQAAHVDLSLGPEPSEVVKESLRRSAPAKQREERKRVNERERILAMLEALPPNSLVVDGEVVVRDGKRVGELPCGYVRPVIIDIDAEEEEEWAISLAGALA